MPVRVPSMLVDRKLPALMRVLIRIEPSTFAAYKLRAPVHIQSTWAASGRVPFASTHSTLKRVPIALKRVPIALKRVPIALKRVPIASMLVPLKGLHFPAGAQRP